MIRKRLANESLAIITCLSALLSTQPALACSVCYGDPDSAMSQGIQAGLLVLLGVVVMVLTGIASLMIFWMRRAAYLNALEEANRQIPTDSRPTQSHA